MCVIQARAQQLADLIIPVLRMREQFVDKISDELFELMDVNGDHVLSEEEFCTGFRDRAHKLVFLNFPLDEQEGKQLVDDAQMMTLLMPSTTRSSTSATNTAQGRMASVRTVWTSSSTSALDSKEDVQETIRIPFAKVAKVVCVSVCVKGRFPHVLVLDVCCVLFVECIAPPPSPPPLEFSFSLPPTGSAHTTTRVCFACCSQRRGWWRTGRSDRSNSDRETAA